MNLMTKKHSKPRHRIMRFPGAARYIDVSLRTFMTLIQNDKIRVVRPSPGCPRVLASDLDAYLESTANR
jgi:hypothetical protein